MKNEIPFVALQIEPRAERFRDMIRGVIEYMRKHRPWRIQTFRGLPYLPHNRLARWDGDGIIAMLRTPEECKILLGRNIPVVNVSGYLESSPFPQVISDNRAIGRLAATHLAERGFRRAAYYGPSKPEYSRQRLAGFRDTLEAAGIPCADCSFRTLLQDSIEPAGPNPLEDVLRADPRPIGILAAHDELGVEASELCQKLGRRVPEDVAIIGVDNDEMLCDLSDPRLSSIAQRGREVGYEAARLLDDLLRGAPVPTEPRLVSPGDVVLRESTDTLAADDPYVAEAVRFIRAHSAEPISVPDILKCVGISRRNLEMRFQRLLGRTPHDEIRRTRIERACKRLVETSEEIGRIAMMCGYNSAARFHAAFVQETNMTPRAYRLQNRRG